MIGTFDPAEAEEKLGRRLAAFLDDHGHDLETRHKVMLECILDDREICKTCGGGGDLMWDSGEPSTYAPCPDCLEGAELKRNLDEASLDAKLSRSEW